jgi:hypothetical protein
LIAYFRSARIVIKVCLAAWMGGLGGVLLVFLESVDVWKNDTIAICHKTPVGGMAQAAGFRPCFPFP